MSKQPLHITIKNIAEGSEWRLQSTFNQYLIIGFVDSISKCRSQTLILLLVKLRPVAELFNGFRAKTGRSAATSLIGQLEAGL